MRASVLVALVCALALAVGGARALGDPVGGECATIQGADGEYAPSGMTKQLKVGLMVTWKGKWNNFSVGNCRAAMTWLRLVKANGGIATKGGGLLGVKLYVVDVSAETAVGNGVLSVGGTKTPTYQMGKQFITDNGLDVSLTPYSSSLSPYAGKAGFETGVPVVATGAAAESVFARPECDDATDCATKAFGCVGPGPERTGRSSISSASPAMPSPPPPPGSPQAASALRGRRSGNPTALHPASGGGGFQ